MDIRFDDLDNNYVTTLDGDITDDSTTINLVDVPPNTTEGFLAIDADNAETIEYIYFNAKGDGYVTSPETDGRGQGGTVAQDHSDGAVVRMYVMREHIKPLRDAVKSIQQALYPIGSVYINAEDDTNPETLLGFGTWEAWGVGKVIVGIDTEDTDFDMAEEIGGEKEHTLTVPEMPAHKHKQTAKNVQSGTGAEVLKNYDGSYTRESSATGDNESHNNLQPYQVGYIWKRTA